MTDLINNNGKLAYYENFISDKEGVFDVLKKDILWRQDQITLYGKTHQTPRLHAWYGDKGAEYSYSQIQLPRNDWHPLLLDFKQKIESFLNVSFNGVLLNYYRDGQDSNGWHSDDEKELVRPVHIASLSFGAPRDFHLRKKGESKKDKSICLGSGSLLFMEAPFQEHWQHAIPKRKKLNQERVNLTFRLVKNIFDSDTLG